MKRILIFLLVLSILFASGCLHDSTLNPGKTPSDSTVAENTAKVNASLSKGSASESKDSGDKDDVMPNMSEERINAPDANAGLSGDDRAALKDGAVWVKYFNTFLPVSRIVDGQQQLLNKEPEWYFEIQKRLGANYEPNKAVIFDARKIYIGSKDNIYDNPLSEGAWLYNPLGASGDVIAMSGDWEPFVIKVRYECYSLESQPGNQSWENYFNAKIKEVSTTTPLIIKNAWLFDIDGDGREESIVNASNTVFSSGLEQSPPARKDTAIYTLTAYFNSDGTAIDMGGHVSASVSSEPVNSQNNIHESYTFDENNPKYIEQFIAAYQYDRNGNVAVCPIFNYGEYSRLPEKNILIADIDGDGRVELLAMFPLIYAPITVYQFNENWQPCVQFAIYTPA
ncbi:hypothetical protein Desde_2670 [Desulfitobacterium dehalogenans ATCC 51507]|uniref:VCBS repeat-containing protein n=1 Tax=Desulfitobacterium dehalogenans (strain ATCC 51507 / DSM 9161 / JW/IU-DC1) TaxID=756499 RepID=I4AAK1_DESDJ|nr:hypothetical protein Desde_2670 [Desulfitobacterium dehalogenans ATCC 51507]